MLDQFFTSHPLAFVLIAAVLIVAAIRREMNS